MNAILEEMISYSQRRWGLKDYSLHRHSILQEVNAVNETRYSLCTEWMPKDADVVREDDLYFEGAATIELDIHSRAFTRAIFVGGKSFADQECSFTNQSDVIRWIEVETGLHYGYSFMLENKQECGYSFKSCISGVPTSPAGYIQVEWNELNQLTLFSKHGVFPSEDIGEKESFVLKTAHVIDFVRQQLGRYKIPHFEDEVINEVYMLEELFIRQDTKKTYPYQLLERPQVEVNQPLVWKQAGRMVSVRKDIEMSREVPLAVALAKEESIDTQPIQTNISARILEIVTDYVSSIHPSESGKWKLATVFRERGLIHAIVRPVESSIKGLEAKLLFMIEPKKLEVMNILDTSEFISIFDHFKRTGQSVITKEEALHALRKHVTLDPVYVYDEGEGRFVLCGKLDCTHVVLADSGNVVCEDEI